MPSTLSDNPPIDKIQVRYTLKYPSSASGAFLIASLSCCPVAKSKIIIAVIIDSLLADISYETD